MHDPRSNQSTDNSGDSAPALCHRVAQLARGFSGLGRKTGGERQATVTSQHQAGREGRVTQQNCCLQKTKFSPTPLPWHSRLLGTRPVGPTPGQRSRVTHCAPPCRQLWHCPHGRSPLPTGHAGTLPPPTAPWVARPGLPAPTREAMCPALDQEKPSPQESRRDRRAEAVPSVAFRATTSFTLASVKGNGQSAVGE